MPPTPIDRIRELLGKARDVAAKAETENRDLSDTERAEVSSYLESAKKIRKDHDLLKEVKDFGDGLGMIDPIDPEEQRKRLGGAPMLDGKGTLGERFVAHEQFKAWMKTVAPAGTINERSRIQSPPLGFAGLSELRSKTLVTGASDTSAGALVQTDYRGLLDEGAYARPLTLLDVVTRGTTQSDLVEYARVTSVTNAAAPVPEATSTTDDDALKPESAIVLSRENAPVITIAHWIPATKRALSDAGQIRTLIDGFLRYGLAEELEDQIAQGDGTGENFEGILNVSGIQSQAWDTDLLTTTRKARTLIRTVGRATPTAYAFNPADLETIDLLKDDQGRFYYGGPSDGGVQRHWRLPVVETEAVPEGTGLVGDFRQAVLWDREQAAISATDSHSDFFVRNLVAILAELRAAFGVLRPAAFCTIDLTSGS